ncbi:MAG: DNA topoisomerase [Lachnospiraceae bacterium]|nr:DNA topoisomerase [Lachnospiraceae bacterium]
MWLSADTDSRRNNEKTIRIRIRAKTITDLPVHFPSSVKNQKRGRRNMIFSATGRKPIDLGWKAVQERLSGKDSEDEGEDDQIFPELNVGQVLNLSKLEVAAKKTAPPKLHTEATLLTAMENAGATLSNGAILKGKGIGTQATRAEHIKGLFDSGYAELKKGKGSNGYIVPTPKGLSLIKVLPPELYSPRITADWEERIAQIAEGKATEDEFMTEFKEFIVTEVDKVKNAEGNVSFKGEKPSYGKCPFCGADVYRYENKEKNNISYYCKDKCGFSISNDSPYIVNRTGKKLTETQCKQIISKGSVKLECRRKSGDGTYSGIFKVKKSEWNGKPSAGWKFEFADNKKKN